MCGWFFSIPKNKGWKKQKTKNFIPKEKKHKSFSRCLVPTPAPLFFSCFPLPHRRMDGYPFRWIPTFYLPPPYVLPPSPRWIELGEASHTIQQWVRSGRVHTMLPFFRVELKKMFGSKFDTTFFVGQFLPIIACGFIWCLGFFSKLPTFRRDYIFYFAKCAEASSKNQISSFHFARW